MVSLDTSHRTFLLLILITLTSLTYFLSLQMKHHQVNSWVKKLEDAHIGLTPQRQGLLDLDVAILVPYRDREIQLKIFINYMNSFLLAQNSSARIYIIEQKGNDPFNRGKLFNIAYMEAKKDYNYSCFIFHDIDLIPENPKLMYRCANQPVHFAVYIDKWNYRVVFPKYFGGVSALTEQQLKKVNGFPNRYWGWGGEDNDIAKRVVNKKYTIYRPPANLARYTMLRFTGKHTQGKHNPGRFALLRRAEALIAQDGLSNLQYELLQKVDYRTYVWLLAELKPNANKNRAPNGGITIKSGQVKGYINTTNRSNGIKMQKQQRVL